jgi:hypothetical protein
MLLLLMAGLFAFSGVGCKGKKAVSQQPQTLEDGVEQLRTALASASPDVQSNLYSGVSYSIRYGSYDKALVSLDRIASDPGLNDGQKRLVNDVIELVKARIQNQGNAPKPAP